MKPLYRSQIGTASWLKMWYQAQINRSAAPVPCNGCNACCRYGYEIELQSDEQDYLETVDKKGLRILQRQADGSCIYLSEQGCSIYERRPASCRSYDCRTMAVCGVLTHKEGEPTEFTDVIKRMGNTVTMKTDRDRIMATALRMAMVELLTELTDPGAELLTTAACFGVMRPGNHYVEIAEELFNHMERLRYSDPAAYAKVGEACAQARQDLSANPLDIRELSNRLNKRNAQSKV